MEREDPPTIQIVHSTSRVEAMKTNGTDRENSHASRSFEQLEVWEADHVSWGSTRTK